jgi:hypothetical protein
MMSTRSMTTTLPPPPTRRRTSKPSKKRAVKKTRPEPRAALEETPRRVSRGPRLHIDWPILRLAQAVGLRRAAVHVPCRASRPPPFRDWQRRWRTRAGRGAGSAKAVREPASHDRRSHPQRGALRGPVERGSFAFEHRPMAHRGKCKSARTTSQIERGSSGPGTVI